MAKSASGTTTEEIKEGRDINFIISSNTVFIYSFGHFFANVLNSQKSTSLKPGFTYTTLRRRSKVVLSSVSCEEIFFTLKHFISIYTE